MDLFAILFYQPLYNLLITFYYLLGQNLGLSIVFLGVFFRFLTIPLTLRQIKFAKDNREMQEKMNELKELHKNNPKKLQEEQVRLQQEYLPGQLAGCLPLLLQLVIFSQIFVVLNNIFNRGVVSFNDVAYGFMPKFAEGTQFNTILFGVDLKLSAGLVGFGDVGKVLPYLILALLVAITQYLSSKVLLGMNQRRQDRMKPTSESKPKENEEKKPDDFAEVLQRTNQQMTMFLPVMLGFFALQFPAGLALYWTTQNGFVIIQQYIVEFIETRRKTHG